MNILNQMTETHRVRDLAKMISEMTGTPIESVKNPAITVALVQYCMPAQIRLRAAQHQRLKQAVIVINGQAPFVVIIVDHDCIVSRPMAAG